MSSLSSAYSTPTVYGDDQGREGVAREHAQFSDESFHHLQGLMVKFAYQGGNDSCTTDIDDTSFFDEAVLEDFPRELREESHDEFASSSSSFDMQSSPGRLESSPFKSRHDVYPPSDDAEQPSILAHALPQVSKATQTSYPAGQASKSTQTSPPPTAANPKTTTSTSIGPPSRPLSAIQRSLVGTISTFQDSACPSLIDGEHHSLVLPSEETYTYTWPQLILVTSVFTACAIYSTRFHATGSLSSDFWGMWAAMMVLAGLYENFRIFGDLCRQSNARCSVVGWAAVRYMVGRAGVAATVLAVVAIWVRGLGTG